MWCRRMFPFYAEAAKERMVAGGGDRKSDAYKSGLANSRDPITRSGYATEQAAAVVGSRASTNRLA